MSIMRSASFEYAPHSIASVKLLVSQTAPLAAFCAGGLFIKLDRTMPLDRTTGVATPLSKSITVIHTCAVHLMICSMMTSAMLMFVIGRLSEAEVLRWAKHHWFLIRFPAMKFVGAVVLYLVIVLLTAYRTMLDEGMDAERIFCLIFGIASMTSLFMVAFLLYRDDKAAPPTVVGKA